MLEVNRYILKLLAVAILFGSISSYRSVEPSHSIPLNPSGLIASNTNSTEAFVESDNANDKSLDFNRDILTPISKYQTIIMVLFFVVVGYFWIGDELVALFFNLTGQKKYQNKDYKGAIFYYNVAIFFYSDDFTHYYFRGIAKASLGDKQGAISDYNVAIRMSRNNAGIYSYRAAMKNDIGDKQGALEDLQESARLYQEQGNTSMYEEIQNLLKDYQ